MKLEILKLKPDFEFWYDQDCFFKANKPYREENPEGDDGGDLRAEAVNTKAPKNGNHSQTMMSSVDLGRKAKFPNLKVTSGKKTEGWRDFDPKSVDGFVDEREIERIKKQYAFENRNFEY